MTRDGAASGGPEPARILVGTMYRGESAFEACRRSVLEQTHPEVEQRVVEGLPNREAHETLYRSFMEAADAYDLFVKLDADMVLRGADALAEVARYFRRRPGLDHAIFAVRDWLSGELIEGLHVFTGRARWTFPDEDLFVDPGPDAPGGSATVWEAPAPLADHLPEPEPYEAFRFGVHRGLKLRQAGRRRVRFGQFLLQRRVLAGCWRRFAATGDRRPGLAVLGAELVLRGELGPEHYGDDETAMRLRFRAEDDAEAPELRDRLAPAWGGPVRRLARQVRSVGAGRLAVGAARMAAYRIRESLRPDGTDGGGAARPAP